MSSVDRGRPDAPGPDEGEQVGVEAVLAGGGEAVRCSRVDLQRASSTTLGGSSAEAPIATIWSSSACRIRLVLPSAGPEILTAAAGLCANRPSRSSGKAELPREARQPVADVPPASPFPEHRRCCPAEAEGVVRIAIGEQAGVRRSSGTRPASGGEERAKGTTARSDPCMAASSVEVPRTPRRLPRSAGESDACRHLARSWAGLDHGFCCGLLALPVGSNSREAITYLTHTAQPRSGGSQAAARVG